MITSIKDRDIINPPHMNLINSTYKITDAKNVV
jgi:hypothetical protein